MKGEQWRLSQVLAVRESLERLPAEERPRAVDALNAARLLDPELTVELIGNLATKKPVERSEWLRYYRQDCGLSCGWSHGVAVADPEGYFRRCRYARYGDLSS